MDTPGRDTCRGGHHIVKFRFAQVRPHLFNATGQHRVNHPAVERQNAFELAFADGLEPERRHWRLTFNHDEAHGTAI